MSLFCPFLSPEDYMRAARVPYRLKPQTFGPWRIRRITAQAIVERDCQRLGFPSYTILSRVSYRTLHLEGESDVVMEDSRVELCKHLPIWLHARGRVLVTGLGLGC